MVTCILLLGCGSVEAYIFRDPYCLHPESEVTPLRPSDRPIVLVAYMGNYKQDSRRSRLFDKDVLKVIFELQEVQEDEVNYIMRSFLTLLRDKVLDCQTKVGNFEA